MRSRADQHVTPTAHDRQQQQAAGDAHVLEEIEEVLVALPAFHRPEAVAEERRAERERDEDRREDAGVDAEDDGSTRSSERWKGSRRAATGT